MAIQHFIKKNLLVVIQHFLFATNLTTTLSPEGSWFNKGFGLEQMFTMDWSRRLICVLDYVCCVNIKSDSQIILLHLISIYEDRILLLSWPGPVPYWPTIGSFKDDPNAASHDCLYLLAKHYIWYMCFYLIDRQWAAFNMTSMLLMSSYDMEYRKALSALHVSKFI